MKKSFLNIIIFFFSLQSISATQKAVICVPIADCISEPFNEQISPENIEKLYREIPISWAGEKNIACPRVHQLLFNEEVMVLKEDDYQVLLETPYLISPQDKKEKLQVWTLKKNIKYISEISPQATRILTKLNANYSINENPLTITLKYPYYNHETNFLFSAGTRFLAVPIENNYFNLSFYDYTQHKNITDKVPSQLCSYDTISKSPDQKIKDFVTLLRTWIHISKGSIPLVWGGASLTQWHYDITYEKIQKTLHNDETIEYWHHKTPLPIPYSGFDSSSLVLRSAQISGIPYFYKNSITAAKNLYALTESDQLSEGDLLFVPGGLLIISSLKDNRIIAAIGYQFGYGKVVEIRLDQLFSNVHTYQDFFSLYVNKEPIYTKKADGSLSRKIEKYVFLSLKNIWK